MRNLPRLLDQCFADPDNVPGLLSAVWQAALNSKLVRTRRTPRGTVIDVKRGRRWFDQGTSDTAWVRALAADPIIFRRLLRLALRSTSRSGSICLDDCEIYEGSQLICVCATWSGTHESTIKMTKTSSVVHSAGRAWKLGYIRRDYQSIGSSS